ncbi:MAG: hypothetical protein IJ860_02775 [Eubacterium sp.]|nr:hypothetical protein [Eubacterium sp.]
MAEYWIIDPRNKSVLVFAFEKDLSPKEYPFTARIPVGVSGGVCVIDFEKIYDRVREYYKV